MGRNTSGLLREAPKREADSIILPAITSAQVPLIAIVTSSEPGVWLTPEQIEATIQLLALHDGNVWKVSQLTGRSQALIWKVKEQNQGAFAEARERWKKSALIRFQDIADRCAEKAAEALETQQIGLPQLMISAGIAVDKAAVLAGEGAVQVHVTHRMDPTQLAATAARFRELRAPATEVDEADFRLVDD